MKNLSTFDTFNSEEPQDLDSLKSIDDEKTRPVINVEYYD